MKHITILITFFILIICFSAEAQAEEDVVWSKFQYPIQEIFNGHDTNFIYANQWAFNRFVKIDANTGVIIDSVYMGSVFGFSKDYKYIYVRANEIETIKKIDSKTYEIVDSIDNFQDIFGRIKDVKLMNDGRFIVTLLDGDYAFAIFNEENFEIINKYPKKEIGGYFYLALQIAVSPKNDYFILDQRYAKLDTATSNWHHWTEVHVWDLRTLQPTGKILFKGNISKFYIFTFSPDGEYVFIRHASLNIFNTNNFELEKDMNATRCIDFAHNSKIFLINLDPTMQYYYLNNFEIACTQPSHSTLSLKLSLNDKYLYKYNAATHMFIKATTCISTDVFNENKNPENVIIDTKSNYLLINELSTGLKNYITNYKISDIKGNIIQNGLVEYDGERVRINISRLNSGIYFLNIGDFVYKFSIAR